MEEKKLYIPVAKWLAAFLTQRFKKTKVYYFDSHAQKISDLLGRKGLIRYFPEGETYDVKVDVLAVGITPAEKGILAIVECKVKPLTVMDISQIIGYSKIIRPAISLIISPAGFVSSVRRLLISYGREDVLEYGQHKKVILAKWDIDAESIHFGEIFPLGYLSEFRGK